MVKNKVIPLPADLAPSLRPLTRGGRSQQGHRRRPCKRRRLSQPLKIVFLACYLKITVYKANLVDVKVLNG